MTRRSHPKWWLTAALLIAAPFSLPALAELIGPITVAPFPVTSPTPSPTPSMSPTATAQAAGSNPIYYRIHPYNVPDQCMTVSPKSGFDQTRNPPVPFSEWAVEMRGCTTANYIANDEFEILNYNDASEWDGKRTGRIIIRSRLVAGSCMENASETGSFSGQDFLFDICASVTPTDRYYFYASVNAYGAIEIQSLTDNKCVERSGPVEVRALTCGGVGNWMVERVGG